MWLFSVISYLAIGRHKKKRFLQVIEVFSLEVGGSYNLNDSTVNSNRKFLPPSSLQENSSYPICQLYNCKIHPITYQSVYAQGRRLYGSWGSALEATGYDYEQIRRKRPKYSRKKVLQDLLRFVVERQGQFRIQELRKHDFALYKGIHNSHDESQFTFVNLPVMKTALIELEYLKKRQSEPYLSPKEHYEKHKHNNVF